MTWDDAAPLAFGLAFAFAVAGCADGSDAPCTNTTPCETIDFTAVAATAPESEITIDGEVIPFGVDGGEGPPEGTCSATLSAPEFSRARGVSFDTTSLGQSVEITCVIDGTFVYVAPSLGDLRDQGVGSRSVGAEGEAMPPAPWTSGEPQCSIYGEATSTIDASSGGSAPFPEVVTADYAKSLTVAVDVTTCSVAGGPTFHLTGELHFDTTSADVLADPNGECRVCGL